MSNSNIKHGFFLHFIAFAFFLVSGCAATATETKNPMPTLPVSIEQEYRINPFDLLEINVYKEDDLTRALRVSSDGYVSFPLIGKIEVAGLTTFEAGDKLAKLLEADYLVNPSVTVLVKEYNTKKVLVLGEVKNPGSYPIPADRSLTVMEAIALAGGFTPNAKIDNTKVIRLEAGEKRYINVKISEITQRGNKLQDIPLKANDIIYIGERVF